MAVVITGVTGGSPAARKKIKPGDRLVSINGHAVDGFQAGAYAGNGEGRAEGAAP